MQRSPPAILRSALQAQPTYIGRSSHKRRPAPTPPARQLKARFSRKGFARRGGILVTGPSVNEDKDPKSAAYSKREVPDSAGSGLAALPKLAPKGLDPLGKAPTDEPVAPEVAPEIEEVSGALLIDDSWPDAGALSAPTPPPRQASKPPPPPLSRMTAGGTLRPAPITNASSGVLAPSQVGPSAPSKPPLPVPSLPPPPVRKARMPATAGASDAQTDVPLEAPTEPSLPPERESALRLPRAWGGVAAGVLRDAVHKAGDSLRPAAHALRDAVPKIRHSLAPAANAVRGVLPKILPESLRSPPIGGSGGAPPWMLPAFGVGGLLLGVGIAVPTGLLLRHPHPASEMATPGASATPLPAGSLGATQPTPATPSCKIAGAPRTLAAKATVTAGVEARAFGMDLALGYAASDTEGVVLRLDPTSLSILATVTGSSKSPIRRVSPVVSPGGTIGIAVDADRKNDVLRGRRTISIDPPLQIGSSAGSLAWAQRIGGPVAGKLWPIDGRGEIDSIRSAPNEGSGDASFGLVFRRKNVVGVALARGGDSPSPQGALSYFNGLGAAVGSPVVAVNDGVVVAAWADRASAEGAWGLRLVRLHAGAPAAEPRMFALPPGGKGGSAISPSIAALEQKGFLLVWSEGPPAERGVRAVALSETGEAVGTPIDISSAGSNAGQGQGAVASSGRGVVAFLQSSGGGFELVATPVTCGM